MQYGIIAYKGDQIRGVFKADSVELTTDFSISQKSSPSFMEYPKPAKCERM